MNSVSSFETFHDAKTKSKLSIPKQFFILISVVYICRSMLSVNSKSQTTKCCLWTSVANLHCVCLLFRFCWVAWQKLHSHVSFYLFVFLTQWKIHAGNSSPLRWISWSWWIVCLLGQAETCQRKNNFLFLLFVSSSNHSNDFEEWYIKATVYIYIYSKTKVRIHGGCIFVW